MGGGGAVCVMCHGGRIAQEWVGSTSSSLAAPPSARDGTWWDDTCGVTGPYYSFTNNSILTSIYQGSLEDTGHTWIIIGRVSGRVDKV